MIGTTVPVYPDIVTFEMFVDVDTWEALPGRIKVVDPVTLPADTLINIGAVIGTPPIVIIFKSKLTIVPKGNGTLNVTVANTFIDPSVITKLKFALIVGGNGDVVGVGVSVEVATGVPVGVFVKVGVTVDAGVDVLVGVTVGVGCAVPVGVGVDV